MNTENLSNMKLTEVPARGKNVKWHKFQQTRTPYNLTLGRTYILGANRTKKAKQIRAMFIRSSAKGFNFLDLSTKKCVFRQPLYRSNFEPYEQENVFLIVSSIVLYQESEEAEILADGFWRLLNSGTQYTAADKAMRSDIIRRHAMSSPTVKER